MFVAMGRRVTARKFRLYACAAARRLWPVLADARTRAAVAVAERYADGGATPEDFRAACATAAAAAEEASGRITFRPEADPWWYGMLRGYHTGGPAVGIWASAPELGAWLGEWWGGCAHFLEQLESGAGFAAGHAAAPLATDTGPGDGLRLLAVRREAGVTVVAGLADLVRCLFPNPFRPVVFSPSWRTSTAASLP